MKQHAPWRNVITAYDGQVPVCLQCGGRDIRPQGIREGLWPGGGEGVAWVCDTCGHIGAPLLVDPEDRDPSGKDRAWEAEYRDTAKALDEPRKKDVDAARKMRNLRNMGILFLVLAGVFFLPALTLLTNAFVTGRPDLVPAVLSHTWIFLGVATVSLVLGVRKVEQAGHLEKENEERSRKGPLAELKEAVEKEGD